MEYIQQIGAIAGLAAFVGLAVLAMLYFGQAKDVRRLRESASFLIEGGEEGTEVPDAPPADRAASQPATKAQPAKGKAAAPSRKPPSDAEAFRRAELARQATERRERFERRRGSGGRGLARGGEGRFASLPEPRALAVIAVGAALLAAGVVFIVTGLGDDEQPATTKGGVVPRETEVAVLNGTSEPGLAAQFAKPLGQQGYKVISTDNTSLPFETSSVFFEKAGEAAARQIAQQLRLPAPKPLIDDVRPDAAGAIVVVVLGEDKAQGA